MLGVNHLVVSLARYRLADDVDHGRHVCVGLSATGVTLSLFTPWIVFLLAVASVVPAFASLALGDGDSSPCPGGSGSLALVAYVIGLVAGVFPPPERHPCLR